MRDSSVTWPKHRSHWPWDIAKPPAVCRFPHVSQLDMRNCHVPCERAFGRLVLHSLKLPPPFVAEAFCAVEAVFATQSLGGCCHSYNRQGLLSLTLSDSEASEQQEYVLIQESMSWENAQTYCRTNHTDLATVQSNENWTRLQEAADEKAHSSFAWIGLYRNINNWCWSYEEESLVFQSWGSGYPKTWLDAQTFCREHYTDLATIRSQDDNDQIINLIKYLSNPVWIGLYRETWKWSNQANITYSTKLTIQTFSSQNCAGANINQRTISDSSCATENYFYCSTVRMKRQVIRVQVKSGQNVDEATLKALVLNELKQMLNNEDVTLTWRTQPNGKVFQKDKTKHSRTILTFEQKLKKFSNEDSEWADEREQGSILQAYFLPVRLNFMSSRTSAATASINS
ncbi:hypothetical protein H4Q32_028158 [Labeo rohita]|uniref:C-type lectin domain-containing protein n=1 Tax=Labeo rohita TaxID=84645 RepID=A0ABQ8MMM7_LABRO|nr:hypothetical protein H4Q32_028158 [Labeo rohita]